MVTSWCMQIVFWDEREVYLLDKIALPVTEKESMQEGKRSIGPWMKYVHANLSSFCAHTIKQMNNIKIQHGLIHLNGFKEGSKVYKSCIEIIFLLLARKHVLFDIV